MQVCFPLGSRHSRHHYKVEMGNTLSKTIAEGALQVTDNETNNFQHMLFQKNCSISISCAMWGSVACKHKARQGLHQPAGRPTENRRRTPPLPPPPWSLSHQWGPPDVLIPSPSAISIFSTPRSIFSTLVLFLEAKFLFLELVPTGPVSRFV